VNYNGTWYYLNNSGAMATGWVNYNGTWYYLNNSGAMATGWVKDGDQWYYLASSGKMLHNTYTPDGYYVDASGAWK
ncbi:N-acetylmuramoyl-L-alanine amidase family protein, partial [Streptococcus mitis]